MKLARAGLTEALGAVGSDREADFEPQACRRVDGIEAAPATDSAAQPAPSLSVFCCEGDYWSLEFGGRTERVRDLKGMHYLARLLAHSAESSTRSTLSRWAARATPLLGEHLDLAIRTGTYCGYLPDPRAGAAWKL